MGKPVNETLSNAYYHHAWKNKIIYSPMGNWFELGYRELEADASSFTVLSKEFGKDENSVFWKDKIQHVDYATFKIDAGVPKDATHVYYDFGYGNSLLVIETADPDSYEPYQLNAELYYYRWGRDKNSYFLTGRKIDVDRNSFTILNRTLAVDTSNIYTIKINRLKSMDSPGAIQVIKQALKPAGSLTIISDNYLQVGNTIFLSNWKNDFAWVPFDQIRSVKNIDERNIVVNETTLISDGELMEDIDISSFEVINRDYLKDRHEVFYDRKKIPFADPATFTPVYEDYSKDSHRVFYQNKVLTGANPITFTYNYSTGIATDGTLNFKDGIVTSAKN
jgi:hypothetical protein